MKKFLRFFILLTIMSGKMVGQSWQPVGGGTNALVRALCVYNNELYVGGDFIQAGTTFVHLIAKWDGSNWFEVGNGFTNCTAINSLIVYNNDLYAGGDFCLLKWDGSSWTEVPNAPGGFYHTMHVFGGKLYVAGQVPYGIWQFDGNNWINIGTTNSLVSCLRDYNGELIACGGFTTINGLPYNRIAKWDGVNWSSMGIGILGGDCESLGTYNNELYIGGLFDASAGNVGNYLIKWDGASLLPVGMGANYRVYTINSLNDLLYLGGDFTSVDNTVANGIASYNGSQWSGMGDGFNNAWSTIVSIDFFQNAIYAAGGFTVADSQIILHIAKWEIESGIHDPLSNHIRSIFPIPSSGTFSIYSDKLIISIRISLTSIDDKVVKIYSGQLSAGISSFSLSGLSSGIYFLKIETLMEGSFTSKIIIEK